MNWPTEFSLETKEQIVDEIRAGHHIQAIKIFRDCSRWGLKDSKDFCDQLREELGLSPVGGDANARPAPWPPEPQIKRSWILLNCRDLLNQGKKIQAVKEIREATGVGLLEAKNFVETLLILMERHSPLDWPEGL